MQSDEANTTNIGCLFSTGICSLEINTINKTFEFVMYFMSTAFHFADLPCYTMPRYASSNVTTISIWSFAILGVLLVTGSTVVAYLMYRKRQKKKLAANSNTGFFFNVLIT